MSARTGACPQRAALGLKRRRLPLCLLAALSLAALTLGALPASASSIVSGAGLARASVTAAIVPTPLDGGQLTIVTGTGLSGGPGSCGTYHALSPARFQPSVSKPIANGWSLHTWMGDRVDYTILANGQAVDFSTVTGLQDPDGNQWILSASLVSPGKCQPLTSLSPFTWFLMKQNGPGMFTGTGNAQITPVQPGTVILNFAPAPPVVPLVNTTLPQIVGTAAVGRSVHATTGTWQGRKVTEYTYQWQRSRDGAAWTSINGVGGTGSYYWFGAADVDNFVRVVVTAHGAGVDVSSSSRPTRRIAAVPISETLTNTDWLLYVQDPWDSKFVGTYMNADFPSAWERWLSAPSRGRPLIAVIDSGIRDPQDFGSRLQLGPGFYADAGDTEHGSVVASELAAAGQDGTPMLGACWSCRILSLHAPGSYKKLSIGGIADAIDYARKHGAKIINISIAVNDVVGSHLIVPSEYGQLQTALKVAFRAGILVVVGAGNQAEDSPSFSGLTDERNQVMASASAADTAGGLLVVGATDFNSQTYGDSNRGNWVTVAAPGYAPWPQMNGTFVGTSGEPIRPGATGADHGTSMATPLVSGLAGLLLSLKPHLTGQQLALAIEQTATKRPGSARGQINAAKALASVIK